MNRIRTTAEIISIICMGIIFGVMLHVALFGSFIGGTP